MTVMEFAGKHPFSVLSTLVWISVLLLTVCVRASVQLQVLHVFAVQLHVEFLQRVVPLPQSWLQPQDPLHVLLHQAGLKSHRGTTNQVFGRYLHRSQTVESLAPTRCILDLLKAHLLTHHSQHSYLEPEFGALISVVIPKLKSMYWWKKL